MALMPKRVKYRKQQRGRVRGIAQRGNSLAFGEFGIQALGPAWVSARQIEAGRVAVMHFLGTNGRLWIRVFPSKPITKKPAETRMGKGKAEPEFWAAVVKPGTMLYELAGVTEEMARQAFSRVAQKMPVRSRFVARATG